MIRHLLRHAIAFGIMSAGTAAWAQNRGPVLRVLDTTKVEGIAGVVLLVNSGGSHNSRAFITNSDGWVSLPCDLCTVTALDPTGLFFSKTTEFDSRSSSIILTLQIRPNVDTVGNPGARNAAVAVYGGSGERLRNQPVIVRPTVMTFENNWSYRGSTDSRGVVSAQLRPGQYVVATLIAGRPWEAPLRIPKKGGVRALVQVHLTPANTVPQ